MGISLDMQRSKGYRFYCSSHSTRIVEYRNTKFLENNLISRSDRSQDLGFVRDQPSTSSQILVIVHNTPKVQSDVEQPIIEDPQVVDDFLVDEVSLDIPKLNKQPVEQHDPPKMLNQH